MVYGTIGLNYKSQLIICEENVDSMTYQNNIIKSGMLNLLPDDYIFMQDGAPAHKSNETLRWLRKRMNLIMNWLANSPDLNPIEHLWGLMKRIVRDHRPKNKQELKDLLLEIWNFIPMNVINNLVLSFEDRLKIVCNTNGECINDYLRMKKKLRPIRNIVIPPDCQILRTEELIASYDPTLPVFYENQGKSFTQEEISFLVNKLKSWKSSQFPYAKWGNKLHRPKKEIEEVISRLRQKVFSNYHHEMLNNPNNNSIIYLNESSSSSGNFLPPLNSNSVDPAPSMNPFIFHSLTPQNPFPFVHLSRLNPVPPIYQQQTLKPLISLQNCASPTNLNHLNPAPPICQHQQQSFHSFNPESSDN